MTSFLCFLSWASPLRSALDSTLRLPKGSPQNDRASSFRDCSLRHYSRITHQVSPLAQAHEPGEAIGERAGTQASVGYRLSISGERSNIGLRRHLPEDLRWTITPVEPAVVARESGRPG